MKKKILFFITAITILLAGNNFCAKANETLEYGARPMRVGDTYNYFVCVDNNEDLKRTSFYKYYELCFDDVYCDEELSYTLTLTSKTGELYYLECSYTFTDISLSYVEYKFDSNVIYSAKYDGKAIDEVITSTKINFEEYTKIKGDYFTITGWKVTKGSISDEYIKNITACCVLANRYIENVVYREKDVYFLCTVSNPTSLETIKTYISATDSTCGDVTQNIKIYNNTYVVDDELTSGTYSFDAYVHDNYGNVTYQKCYVRVVDNIGPVFSVKPDYYLARTDDFLQEEDILGLFEAVDAVDGDNVQITFYDIDEYFYDNQQTGFFNFWIYATDQSGNQSKTYFTLEVIDADFPTITIDSSYSIIISKGDELTSEQIQNYFNSLGILSAEVVSVESEYFNSSEPEGEYDVVLTLSNGSHIESKIIVHADNIDYTPKTDSNNTFIYVGASIIAAMLVIVSALAIVRLKKKR